MKAVQQLLFDVDWRQRNVSSTDLSGGAELDVLVIDLPPGTGDVQLSLGQLVECDGGYRFAAAETKSVELSVPCCHA